MDEVTHDSLFNAVLYEKMTPAQAELIAKQSGLPPLAPQPDPADYNAMLEAWWTLPMTIAWIAWRSPAEVIEVWDRYRCQCSDWHYRERILDPTTGDAHKGYLLEPRQSATVRRMVFSEGYRRVHGTLPSDAIGIRDAMTKLRAALSGNQTQATGVKADTRHRIPIPHYEWRDLEFLELAGRDVARFRDRGIDDARGYDNLAFPRQDITAIWPVSRMDERDQKPPETGPPTGAPETHSGGPGRPSMMHLIEAEYDGRKERGEIHGGIGKIAADLHDWAKDRYPTYRIPGAGAIANALRDKHRSP
jgi:hypothetical protein